MANLEDLIAKNTVRESFAKTGSITKPLVGGFSGEDTSPFLKQFKEEPQEKFEKTEVLKAAFETENTIGSGIANLLAGNYGGQEEDLNYDVVGKVKNTEYEPYLNSFYDVYNDKQFEAIKQKIDKEKYNRNVTNSSGAFGFASNMLAGIVDPINVVPIGGSAYKAIKMGNVVKGSVQTAKAAALSEIAAESILQSQQDTRTLEESAFNIAGTTLLGGVIGGTAAKFSKKEFSNLAKRLEDDFQNKELSVTIDNDGNLSAAKTPLTTLEQESLAGGKATQALIQGTKKLNPMLRVMDSKTRKSKDILQKLVRTNMYFKKNEDGIATQQSVEINKKRYDAGLAIASETNQRLFKELNSKDLKSRLKSKIGVGYKEFNDQVSLAMIRDDKHEIPEIQQAAQTWRREVFDPLKQEAIEQELLPADVDVKTATSYLMRQYNVKKIIAQEPEFKDILRKGVKQDLLPKIRKELKASEITPDQLVKLKSELKDLNANIFKLKGEDFAKAFDTRLELMIKIGDEANVNKYIEDIVSSVYDNIRGVEKFGANMPYDIKVGVRGPAKERVLNFVRDEELRPYLETDINILGQNYTRVLGTDVELKRAFGSLDLEDEFAEMKTEYNKLREKASSEKERTKLDSEEKEVRDILNAFKDIMRGNYGQSANPDDFWHKASRISRSMQYMSKLGGVALSSIPDAARHLMVHGYGKVFGKGVKNVIFNLKGVKLSIADAKLAGQLTEAVTHQRAALMGDINNPYSSDSAFEKMVSSMAQNFGKLTGLDMWNNYQKAFASLNTQQRLIDNLSNWDKSKDKRYMAFLGIDDSNQSSIARQLKKYGTKDGDVSIANLKDWDDLDAARLYKNALNTDVDRTIVTKGVGDVPLLMNKELGKTIFQFKSFAFAAHQQVLIAGMQQADAAVVSGTMTMISMGMMTYYLKTIAAGREVSNDPEVWLAEGVDRSGIIPVLMEMNGIADIMGVGVGSVLGGQPLSRYASRNKVGALIGPSFGAAQDVSQVSSAIARGDFSENDLKAIRRNLPMQNLFYLRGLIDDAQEAIAK